MANEKRRNEEMPANEWGQLRSYLARIGVSQAEIDEAIGGARGARNRQVIIDLLIAWLKERPKA